jgi:hypothetical protein
VIKDLLDHLRVFVTGDDLDGTAAFAACLNIDIEYAFQSLRPSHGDTPWKRVRLTPGLGTRATNLAMKSSGLKITCVVPSRYGIFSC